MDRGRAPNGIGHLMILTYWNPGEMAAIFQWQFNSLRVSDTYMHQ